MNTRITTALAVAAGFLGGAMSQYVFAPTPVQAQGPTEIRAQRFVLVDQNGMARGVFGFQDDGTPAVQVRFGEPTGLANLIEAEVVSARRIGIDRKKSILPDLK